MPKRSASIPPLVYVRMAAATRRVPGLRVAAPRDGRVLVYARGRLLTLPAPGSRPAPRSSTGGSSRSTNGSAASWPAWGRGR